MKIVTPLFAALLLGFADATSLWDRCPDDNGPPHNAPLATHFLQGTGAFISLSDDTSGYSTFEGIKVNLEIPLDQFAPITQYVYTFFDMGNEGLSRFNSLASAYGSSGKMDHGFLSTTTLLQNMSDAYDAYENAPAGTGYTSTVYQTLQAYKDTFSCNVEPSMEFAATQGECRPPPNSLLSFLDSSDSNENIISGTDSSFIMEIIGLNVDADTGMVKIVCFVPETLDLIEYGTFHEIFKETKRHYHFNMDCASAVNQEENASNLKKKIAALGDAKSGPFSITLKTK